MNRGLAPLFLLLGIGSPIAFAEDSTESSRCKPGVESAIFCSEAEAFDAGRNDRTDEESEARHVSDWTRPADSERCDRPEGLPPQASCSGVVITVDTTKNVLYLFRDGELVRSAPAATGSNQLLVKGLRKWLFRTPHGRMPVLQKRVDPVWTRPDWAFVEAGQMIPPPGSPKRKVSGVLGKYALDLGDGILIHGTKDLDSLGRNASHGCIRLGDEMLELVYETASVGTPVHVF